MSSGSPHYLPLSLPYFSVLGAVLLGVIIVVELRALRLAYERAGLSSRAAILILIGSLVGSYFNIPIAQLPARQTLAQEQVPFFGMSYVVPVNVEWPGTLIAINLGGAAIPILVSLYLLVTRHLWIKGIIAVAAVAVTCHLLAYPVRGVGIAMPVFVPPITTAIVALVLSREYAAPLAYIGGSLGALIGADLLNLGTVDGLGAPVASIGGAGTFDGVFLTGVLAVLLASIFAKPKPPRESRYI